MSRALMLTEVERGHLFMLALGRRPAAQYRPREGVTPRLQRVLDALDPSPALVRTMTWDIMAWNAAAAAVLTDYGALPPASRNVLRLMFLSPHARVAQVDGDSVACFGVAAFRADAARAGAASAAQPLVDGFCRESPDFAAMWGDDDVQESGEGLKRLRHPVLGEVALA